MTQSVVSTRRHRGRQLGLLRSWPSYLFILIVIAATLYAFSPRHIPPFPATRLKTSELIMTGLAQQGPHIIAVGELGHIFYSDNPKGPWHAATIKPQQGSTFTYVKYVAKGVALAAGHGGWIVRSTDDGKTWKQVAFEPKNGQPVLGLAGPFDGKLYAFGAFGLMMTSQDLGKTWQTIKFDISTAASKTKKAAPVNPNADPFANYSTTNSDLPTRHLYGMTQFKDGSLLLVGERGLVARSTDGGKSWLELPQIYDGSFFGLLKLSPDTVLIYGMRGHVFITRNEGKTWRQSDVPQVISFFGGTVMPDGKIVLVGAQDTVMVSTDGGLHFKMAAQSDRGTMDAVLGFGHRQLLTAGIYGLADSELPADLGAAARIGTQAQTPEQAPASTTTGDQS